MSSRPTRLVYFVPECQASKNAVFHAQLLGQAGALEQAGFECMIVASDRGPEGVSQALELPAVRELCTVRICDLFPRKPSFFNLWQTADRVVRRVRREIEAFHPDAIYTRSIFSCRHARRLARDLNAVDVHDVRGLPTEEAAYKRGRMTLPLKVLRRLEIGAIRKAQKLLCVSFRLAEWIRDNVGRDDAKVVPSCIDMRQFGYRPEARIRIRKLLGWPLYVPVAVYCGGLSAWQRIDDILTMMAETKSSLPAMKVLFLTTASQEMTRRALKAGLKDKDFASRAVRHDEMGDWLNCADVGVILRDNVLINNVASPVKMAEYLASGLPVVCSDGIGDLSETVEQMNAGILVRDGDPQTPEKLARFLERVVEDKQFRSRALALAREGLSWEAHLKTYCETYSKETG